MGRIDKKVEALAQSYGYSGFFALVPRKQAGETLDRARAMGDQTGIILGLALLGNRNAYDKAHKELYG